MSDRAKTCAFLLATTSHTGGVSAAESPVAAMPYVPKDVAQEVQDALLALQAHADAYVPAADDASVGMETSWNPTRCDTTPELARLAFESAHAGKLAGFRTSRSYSEVRTMHERAGFLQQDDKGDWRCIRADTLYESILCPSEHYKLPLEEYEQACDNLGLPCKEGFDCYCKPCVKAFEVDIFQWTEEMSELADNHTHHNGCEKMSLCGSIQQTKTIIFHAVDNKRRDDAVLQVTMHLATEEYDLPVKKLSNYTYEITWSENTVGVGIMEVYINGVQIPESPIRVQVEDRQCELDFPGQLMANDRNGDCICRTGTIDIRDRCVESTIIAVAISISAVILVAVVARCYLLYRNRKGDQMWKIHIDELQFDDPVEVIGQGSFGVILLAQYHGTKVAIKRALKVDAESGSRKKNDSPGGSTVASPRSNDSVGLVSVDSNESPIDDSPFTDPELGEDDFETEDGDNNKTGGALSSTSGTRSGIRNPYNLDFLVEDFGRSKWAWLSPWLNRDDYRSRFKESILSGNSAMSTNKSLHAHYCPWFNSQIRREEEFVSEMRVLARLRHSSIATVLGAVISRSHEPMLVMEYMEYGSLHDLLRNETMHLSG